MRPMVLPQPKMLLDALAHDLTQTVTVMPRGAAVDGATTPPGNARSDVRCDLALTAGGDKVGGIVGFVGADAAATGFRHGIEHGQCRAALAEPSAWETTALITKPLRFSISTWP